MTYGPNASGKTNIIGAMEVLRSIVLRGNIRNVEGRNEANTAVYKLEVITNRLNDEKQPVNISIKFIEKELLIEYQLSLDLGMFLEGDYNRKVLSESLLINEGMVFSRNGGLVIGDLKVIRNYLVNGFEDNEAVATMIAINNLIDDELFLMNGFKAIFSSELVNIISDWFKNKFNVIYRADAFTPNVNISNAEKKIAYIESSYNEAAKMFGVNSNDLGYIMHDEDSEPTRISIFSENKGVVAEGYESYGTIRFLNMFPLVMKALLYGGTLIVDELDASLHPMALMNIINIFHNDDINKKNAQLIFNTHNPIFLNSNLFRRDEIKFVERDDINHNSIHYSLSDFGTSGEKGVRKNEDYMKSYFINQYGAIKDIDFTSIFDNLLKSRDEELKDV